MRSRARSGGPSALRGTPALPGARPVAAPHGYRERTVATLLVLHAGATLLMVGVATELAWAGAGALAVVWALTALLQVPRHRILSGGWDAAAARGLVTTSVVRTIAWTARAGLVLAMLAQATR